MLTKLWYTLNVPRLSLTPNIERLQKVVKFIENLTNK